MTTSLKMPAELLARLTTAARQRGVSRSALVREALASYLGSTREGGGSAADLASDLVGSLEGPRGLSYSPKHMKGFGL